MIDTGRQFRVLYRHFLGRLMDIEALAVSGDPTRLYGQVAAVLAALNLVMGMTLLPRYMLSELPAAKIALAGLGDQEFLISTSMTVAGILAVVAWGAVFPDLRDCLILGALPIRVRTVFRAKLAAIGTALAVALLASNALTAVGYPVLAGSAAGLAGALRMFAAYWLTVAAAGLFVFCTLLGLQGVTACLLPYRWYLKVSSVEQVAAFFAVVGVYFATPGPSEMAITAPENLELVGRFPSFWFLGVFQMLNGTVHPMFAPLAQRACVALATAVGVAGVSYAVAYFSGMRKAIELAPLAPSGRKGMAGRLGEAAARLLARRGVERAVLLFAGRTLARSAQHRLILAVYLGIAMAVALAYAKNMLWSGSALYQAYGRQIVKIPWWQPNVPLMAGGLVVLLFALMGTRAVFALPASLPANWIFRVTRVAAPGAYFNASRRALYSLAALPVWLCAAAIYLTIWPAAPALAHLLVLGLIAVAAVERQARGFRKIPFTCGYAPGKSDMTRKLGAYAILFLALTDLGVRMERYSMDKRVRFVFLATVLVYAAARARKRWREFARVPGGLQFQDAEAVEIATLNLRGSEGAAEVDGYGEGEAAPEKPLRARLAQGALTAAGVTAAIPAAGAVYESVEARGERERTAHIGRLVDMGGRSLNIWCVGEGGPTVVFEAGGGGVGYAWTPIQREVAKLTRACWYDRAGHGRSDGAEYPRDSLASARDLHELLNRAGVARPVILVGASLGGFIARVYASEYPDEVAGVVLADSSHIDERLPIPRPEEWNMPDWFYAARNQFTRAMWHTGMLRVFFGDDYSNPQEKWLTAEESARLADLFGPKNLAGLAGVPFYASARQARKARPMRGKPLVVLTAGQSWTRSHNPLEVRQARAAQQEWIEAQAQLVRYSDRARQVVLPNSRHCIQCDAPEAIVDAVREVLGTAKAAK